MSVVDRFESWRGRVAASAIGAALLAAAVIAVWIHREALVASWVRIERPPIWAILALPLSTVASLSIGTVLFDRLLRDLPNLDRRDLAALVASSAFFNLLPLKAGLVGRAAWQRRHQQVPIRRSALVSVQLAGLTLVAIVLAIVAILVCDAVSIPMIVVWSGLIAVVFACGTVGTRTWRRGLFAGLCLLLGWRLIDVAVWSVRFVAGFAVIGVALEPASGLALACVASATGLVPIVGTTLGVREWVVALLAPSLAGVAWDQALAAELIARGIEVAVLAAVGGLGTWWLWRRSFCRSESHNEGGLERSS